MSAVIPFEANAVGAAAKRLSHLLGGSADDLSDGVSGGFAVISLRASKWRIRKGGEETLITDDQGEARPSIRVLMLKASPRLSKNYYANGYVEGSIDAPDCFSSDGVRPDPSSPAPQSAACANCPHNVFGSRVTESGASRGKACSDVRRIAVVPEGDMRNEAMGGPMLLRVPPASLAPLAQYGKLLKGKGFAYNTVITRLSFDPDASGPRVLFNAVRPMTGEEAADLEELVNDAEFMGKIDAILAQEIVAQVAPAEEAEEAIFEESAPAPAKTASAKTASAKTASAKTPPAKTAAPKPAPAKTPPTKAVQVEEEEDPVGAVDDDDELNSILDALDSLNG